MLVIARVSANAIASPNATPAMLRRSPWPTTRLKMVPGAVPSAMRTPISRFRWRTAVKSTPYNPTPARIAAIDAKTPIRSNSKRVPDCAPRTSESIGFQIVHHKLRTGRRDDGTDLRRESGGRARSPQHPIVGKVADVTIGHKNLLAAGLRQRCLALVGHHADDLHPLGLRRVDADQ
jgi:hypothetical protein